jgi:hypothetical protein
MEEREKDNKIEEGREETEKNMLREAELYSQNRHVYKKWL